MNKIKSNSGAFGYLSAIGATAIFSGNFIIARGISQNIPPISLNFWRWIVAVVVLLPFALKHFMAERHFLKKHVPYLCVTSLLGITIFNSLIYFAGHTTTAINLSLISLTFPIFIVILSRFLFNELLTFNKVIGIILVLFGVLTLITKGNLSRLLNLSFATGDIWMLLASITVSVYSILLKYKPEELSIPTLQFSTFILGLVFLAPFFVWEYVVSPPVDYDSKIICSILYVGIFASLLAYILWNNAVMIIGPAKTGMIYYTLPIFSGLLAYLLLNENIQLFHYYSVLLIVLGIFATNYQSKELKQSR